MGDWRFGYRTEVDLHVYTADGVVVLDLRDPVLESHDRWEPHDGPLIVTAGPTLVTMLTHTWDVYPETVRVSGPGEIVHRGRTHAGLVECVLPI